MLPDLSDDQEMARAGRLSILKYERRKAGQRLRDALLPIINNLDGGHGAWNVSEITELCTHINELTDAIDKL